MKLNEKIFENRKKLGMSQEDLANKLDVSRQTVSKWEVGNATPEVEKLVKLSELFGVSVDYLVKENEEEYKKNGIVINKKVILKVLIALITVILIILCINKLIDITRNNLREKDALAIINAYNEGPNAVGETKSGIIDVNYHKSSNNKVEESRIEYCYYIKDNEKILKIRPYENDIKTINKEYYINLNTHKEYNNLIFDNVIEVNLEDLSQKVINDFEINKETFYAANIVNRRYSIATKYKPENVAKEIAENQDTEIIYREDFQGYPYYHIMYGDETKQEDYLWISIMTNFSRVHAKYYYNDISQTKKFYEIEIRELDMIDKSLVLPPEE